MPELDIGVLQDMIQFSLEDALKEHIEKAVESVKIGETIHSNLSWYSWVEAYRLIEDNLKRQDLALFHMVLTGLPIGIARDVFIKCLANRISRWLRHAL